MKKQYTEYTREEKIDYFRKKIAYFEAKIEKDQARLDELLNETALQKAISKKCARSK